MMTDAQRLNVEHALGLDRGPTSYRNFFITDAASADAAMWHELVALGYADVVPHMLAPNSLRFRVTEAGRAALTSGTPEPPQ